MRVKLAHFPRQGWNKITPSPRDVFPLDDFCEFSSSHFDRFCCNKAGISCHLELPDFTKPVISPPGKPHGLIDLLLGGIRQQDTTSRFGLCLQTGCRFGTKVSVFGIFWTKGFKKTGPRTLNFSRVIPGHPPKVLDPLMVSGTPSYSHTLPISSGILDWEWEIRDYYGKLKGVPSFRGGPWNSHWTSEWCILELLGETEWLSQCDLVGLQRLMLPCVGKKDAE